ncbi:MAG: hypothetical protein GSR77_03780 [Desulfurococcales archaeon]|nr:hypothetical protein [Desulfurococcales archaeon]
MTSPTPQLAWLIGLLSMLVVFLWFSRSYGLRPAFLIALVWGKLLAGVFFILHIDIELATIYWYNPETMTIRELFKITANELIFLSFLITTMLTLAWPSIERELGIKGIDLLARTGRKK